MIVDVLDKKELYYGVHKNFKPAFEFIEKVCKESLDLGKYELDGKNLYAMVQEYDTKDEGNWECHRKYIDIQFIVSGTEVIEGFDIKYATAKSEYNDVKDVMFYEDYQNAGKGILNANEYGIFFPHDVHKPGMCLSGKQNPVKKIVVKVKV